MVRLPTELRCAVRWRVLSRYLGLLCLVIAALGLVPALVAVVGGELGFAWRAGAGALGLGIVGALLARVGAAPAQIQSNEAIVIVGLVFVIAPLPMTWPLTTSGLPFTDALFEAVSGVTTTGLSTRASLAGATAAELFTRAWLQWFGGLGIVVLSLAILFHPGSLAKRLAVAHETDDVLAGTRSYARHVVVAYVALTAMGCAALARAGAGGYDALLPAMAAVSTGGVAVQDGSLAAAPAVRQWIVAALCFAGATPLVLFAMMRLRRARLHATQIATLGVLAGPVAAALLLVETDTGGPALVFLALSAQTTAGFSASDVAELTAFGKLVLVFSMLVGGCVGSTAGGAKILRLLVVLRVLRIAVARSSYPKHAVIEPTLAGHELHGDEARRALVVVLLFAATAFASWMPFVACGYEPVNALFEVASATATVGLSAGLCGPDLPTGLKLLLCADMWLGRLEIFAYLVVLAPGTWLGRRQPCP